MKDPRYTTIFFLLKENAIQSFKEIFTYLPYTIVAKDIHVSFVTMKEIVVGTRYNEQALQRFAEIIGCDAEVLIKLAIKNKKNKKSRRL